MRTDLRIVFRTLLRSPAYAGFVVAILALCIAANVAVFEVVYAVLLKPLPFKEPQRLVAVFDTYSKAGILRGGTSPLHVLERKASVDAFEDSAAWQSSISSLGGARTPVRVGWTAISPSFFTLLGVSPALGRDFTAADTQEGRNSLMILSDGLWRSEFGADPAVIGRTVRLDGFPLVVVGVMPKGFRFPGLDPQLWVPLTFTKSDLEPSQRYRTDLGMIARLRNTASVAQAQAEVSVLDARPVPGDYLRPTIVEMGFRGVVRDLQADSVATFRPVLGLLQVSVVFVMAIAAVNLSGLFLVRSIGRSLDFTIRQALGATPLRMARMLLAEIVILASIGLAAGLAVAAAAFALAAHAVGGMAGFDIPDRLLGVAALFGTGTALLAGLSMVLPAFWHLRATAALEGLSDRSATLTLSKVRTQRALSVVQVGLALTLVYGASLLAVSFLKARRVDPGFVADKVASVDIDLPWDTYKNRREQVRVSDRLLAHIRGLPGVVGAGGITRLPFTPSPSFENAFSPLLVENRILAGEEARLDHYYRGVSAGYFETMRIPLEAGRLLNEDDCGRDRHVCVIDSIIARRYWPGGDAVGRRLSIVADQKNPEYMEIVGVVGATKQNDLAHDPGLGVVYYPQTIYWAPSFTIAVRTALPAEAVLADLRRAVAAVDPALPAGLRILSRQISASLDVRRLPLAGCAAFSFFAALLAGIGIYGMLALSVSLRVKEIGIRMALGAAPGDVRRLYLRSGLGLASIGTASGAVGAWWIGDLFAAQLYGVSPHSLPVFLACVSAVFAVGLAAAGGPALRAGRVRPTVALR